MEAHPLPPLPFSQGRPEGRPADNTASHESAAFRRPGFRGPVAYACTQRRQQEHPQWQAFDSPMAYPATQIPTRPGLFPQRPPNGGPPSANVSGGGWESAFTPTFSCFHVSVQRQVPFVSEAAMEAKEQPTTNTLAGDPSRSRTLPAILHHRSAQKGNSLRSSTETPSRRTPYGLSWRDGRGCGPWPSDSEVPCAASAVAPVAVPAAPATAAPVAGPAAVPTAPVLAAPAMGSTGRYEEGCGIETPVAVRSSWASSGGVLNSSRILRNSAARGPPHYWSNPVSYNRTPVASRSSRTDVTRGGAALAASRDAAKLRLPRALDSCKVAATGTSAATAAEEVATAMPASKRASSGPHVSPGTPMVTRRQTAAAALAEVVRIDDSSDEECSSAPPKNPSSTALATTTLALTQGSLPSSEESGRGPSLRLAEKYQEATGETKAAKTAYVLLSAAIVEGDGRCCLLSAETVARAAAESGEWGQEHQQPCSSSNCATAVQTPEKGTDGRETESSLLVLQADQDKRVVSLDMWSPPTVSSRQTNGESGQSEGPIGVSGEASAKDTLYNVFSFPVQSICQMQRLNLRTDQSPPSNSGKCASTKELYRRCGSEGNVAEMAAGKEITGRGVARRDRERKHRETPACFEGTEATATKISDEPNTITSGRRNVSHTAEIHGVSFMGSLTSAATAAKEQTADVPPARAVAAAPEGSSIQADATLHDGKEGRGGAGKRKYHGGDSADHKPQRSEGSKGAAKPRSSSDSHRRHDRSHSGKVRSGHSSTKRRHSSKREESKSREKRPRSSAPTAERPVTSGAPTTSGDRAVASDTHETWRQQFEGPLFGPRNALNVTDGKVVSGRQPQMPRGGSPEITPNAEVPPPCSDDNRDNSNLVNKSSVAILATREVISGMQGKGDGSLEGNAAEPLQHAREGDLTLSSSTSDEQRRHSVKEGATGTRHSSEKSGHDGYSCPNAARCSLHGENDAIRHSPEGSAPTVAVLCLELEQAQTEELQCRKLLQRLLLQYQKSSNGDPSPVQVDGKETEYPQAEPARPSSEMSRPPSSSFKKSTSKQMSCDSSNNSSSTRSMRTHRHHRGSKDRPEEEGRRRCSSPSNHSPQKSFSHKRPRSSIPRRQPKSGTSSKRKKRREASSSTAATASDICGKTSSNSGVADAVLQHANCNCYSRQDNAAVSQQTTPASCGRRCCLLRDSGSNTNTLVGSAISNWEPTGVEASPPANQPNCDYLPGSMFAQGRKRGLLLLLCLGPPLHVAGGGRGTSSSVPEGSAKKASLHPLDPILDSSPSSSFAVCSSSTVTDQQVPRRADTTLSCKRELMKLRSTLLPAASAVPEGWAENSSGSDECVAISTLAKSLTLMSEDQLNRSSNLDGSSEQKNNSQIEVPRCLTEVLEGLVCSGLGPWNARCLPVETLVALWKMRSIRTLNAASMEATEGSDKPGFARPAVATSANGSIDKNESPKAAASQVATTSPPVFDLLLDDKTLRRLSEKEFLDDTIIDFCLKFIVDHILTPDERLRVHISNTFFLSALMGQKCEVEGHSRLTRWLKKELAPLPTKDFIFIPVHHKHQHWSLAVLVYPWRAVNLIAESPGHHAVGQAPGATLSNQNTDDQGVEVLLSNAHLAARSMPSIAKNVPDRIASLSEMTYSATKRRVGQEAARTNLSGKAGGPHSHKDIRSKARMFHVDSMGLRSVFDCCRGRLKRFLRREFEHCCGGLLESGERADFCTESCCWQDGLSCPLHTPRQQNGYDCGVFVVEYVHFLTRNLNAIETLLSGPSRDPQPHDRLSCSSRADRALSPHRSLHGNTHVESGSQGGLLETMLGFSCPCMAVESSTRASKRYDLSAMPTSNKARLAQLKAAKTNIVAPAALEVSTQQQPPSLYCAPTSGHQTEGVATMGAVVTRPMEQQRISTVGPYGAINAQGNRATTERLRQAGVLTAPLHTSSVSVSAKGCRDATDGPRAATLPSASAASCPPWGPLPHSFSKRRSVHTKWFSQDRVTQRRLQLHKMLLFMRQNILWREDPKLVAYLKSLFLDCESS